MFLFILLLVPTIIFVVGAIFGRGKITFKELIVEEVAMVIIIAGGYFIARNSGTHDVEIWNGWIAESTYFEEWVERVSCRHPISCSHQDKNGNTLHSNDGYYHLYDEDYHSPYAETYSSNGELIIRDIGFHDYVTGQFKNNQYVEIRRYAKLRGPGNKFVTRYQAGSSNFIPTAVEHGFTNYIKVNPTSLFVRVGQGNRFDALISPYPRVRSVAVCDRVIPMGISLPDIRLWNDNLAKINGRLGRKKQVNIILLVVNTADSSYVHALEEKWLGGKKNDLIIVIGCAQYPNIDWVRIVSWSKSEDLKVQLRDYILDIKSLDQREKMLEVIEREVDARFVRRPMADFKYLMAGWQPSPGISWLFLLLGIGISIGLTIFFIHNDPFGDEQHRYYRY